MRASARRSSSARVNRGKRSISGSRRTVKPARSSARTPRCSHPSFGAYDGDTTPIVSPFTIAGGRSKGMRLSYERITRFTTMTSPSEPSTYFRKGFGLKTEVQGQLASDYAGDIVDLLRSHDFKLTVGDVTIRLAREFGFCYGVERAVDYAYQTRRKFPDRRVVLVGEIIHNPHVNDRLREMGVEILMRPEPTGSFDFSSITSEDVVLMPAFGVTIGDFAALREI